MALADVEASVQMPKLTKVARGKIVSLPHSQAEPPQAAPTVGRRVTVHSPPNIPPTEGMEIVAVTAVTIVDATPISKRTVKTASNLNLIGNSATETTRADLISPRTREKPTPSRKSLPIATGEEL
jgi:hypothetical protein